MVNISWFTFGVVVVTVIIFSVLDYYGFKPPVFFYAFSDRSCPDLESQQNHGGYDD